MHTGVNFSKLENCNQYWDTMKKCEGGRLCTTCNEVIHDFRGMSEWDVALVHSKSDAKVCGIYDPIHFKPEEVKRSITKKHVLFASLLGLATPQWSSAQMNIKPSSSDQEVHAEKDLVLKK